VTIAELQAKSNAELHELAKGLGVTGYTKLRKRDLIREILRAETEKEGLTLVDGILEILPDGYGFLRVSGYTPGPNDVYVSPSQIRRFSLRTGDSILGQVRPPKDSERYHALLKVLAVNMLDPDRALNRPLFDDLTPVYPQERIKLEVGPKEIAMRLMDIISPLGKGRFAGRTAADNIALASRLGWMPSYPTFDRNPLDLADEAEAKGVAAADHVVAELKAQNLRPPRRSRNRSRNKSRRILLSRPSTRCALVRNRLPRPPFLAI